MKAHLTACVLVVALFATPAFFHVQDDQHRLSEGQQEAKLFFRRDPLRYFCIPLRSLINSANSLIVNIGGGLANATTSQLLFTLLDSICPTTRIQHSAEPQEAAQPQADERFFFFNSLLRAKIAFCARSSSFLTSASAVLNTTDITAMTDQQVLITILTTLCTTTTRDLDMDGEVEYA